ncbi:hypothetical protein [Verrucomicrobium spinosum]|uniref:hypothetical protein n=1 Tax=Verrucomicrobium spinosum TaxID=2736 RepID=UPI000946315B|nr:hypothetical protein [Verrucomicrobium spinosum]
MSNTIDSALQLSEVLDSSMRALKRTLLPLLSFSTVFRNVHLKGNDKMAIPFYPLTRPGPARAVPRMVPTRRW